MRRKVIILMAVFVGFLAQYSFLAGIGAGVALMLVLLDITVWTSFFLRKDEGYLAALGSGLLSELISPYRFGTMIVGFLLAFLAADFFAKKVFANRMLHSYLLASVLGIVLYFSVLAVSDFVASFFAGGASLPPLEFSALELRRILFWNAVPLLAAFFITNALTKKMHAAFLVR